MSRRSLRFSCLASTSRPTTSWIRIVRGSSEQAALAVAQLVYNEWRRRHVEDPRWLELRARGARRQCLLWASTSTKDPDLSATHYVERLLAPHSVVTMPGRTLDEFCHLDASSLMPLEELDEGEAMEMLSFMESSGVGPAAVAEALQREGVQQFAASFDSLLRTIRSKGTAPSNR